MQPSFPSVSVVIPCFNAERTLAETVESALAQSYPNVEVVTVDDGSKDGSARILDRFAGQVVRVSGPNRGLSAARNAGVAASRGEYITLLDADDLLLPECVARRAEILNGDPQIGLVAGYFREIDERGEAFDRVPELRKVWEGHDFRQAVRRNWGPPVGWTFRREAFLRVGGFDPLLPSCEDWDFVIRVASRYRIAYDETVQVLYRKSAGQMSSQHATMLDAARRIHLKNRAVAPKPFEYWIDTQFGRFELGRRTLFAVLFQQRERRVQTLGRLLARYPHLLWVGALSGVSFLAGKRPSARS